MDTKGKGLLYEMKNGYPITMSEEEYKAKEKEIRSIASDLYVNMDVLDLVEKDYKLKLLSSPWPPTSASTGPPAKTSSRPPISPVRQN